MRRSFSLIAAGVFLCSISLAQQQAPAAQDPQGEAQQQPAPPPPSLGEIARQLKLKKQQKEAQLKQAKAPAIPEAPPAVATESPEPAKTAHLVTNDETPERASVTPVSTHSAAEPAETKSGGDDLKADAEKWKSQILQQKTAIAALQEDIKTTSDSIHYAGANCVANCAQWNEKQQQKQQEVDTMKAQLEDAQKQLEEMQEAARKEGFGSSVYDP
jgi:hypothetical protein